MLKYDAEKFHIICESLPASSSSLLSLTGQSSKRKEKEKEAKIENEGENEKEKIECVTEEEARKMKSDICFHYFQGLQWVLHYYFR